MKKKTVWIMLMLTALLFTGCAVRRVEEMYALPRRSQEYSQLQVAVDHAMAGMSYSAPVSGDNQQTVQTADLDGDGVDEYLIFASDNSEKPLKVLIFAQTSDGSCRLVDTIESNGAAFEQVEYVDLDANPGCELVIGRQVSDQVLRSVSVYTYQNGSAEQQLLIGYSRFFTCDLDQNGQRELMVIRPGEAHAMRGMAVLYSFRNGRIERSAEAQMSRDPSNIRRITHGKLQSGDPAVFVASVVDDSAIMTDIFAIREGRFSNISLSSETETSISTLRNYYVYAEDIDEDGIMELPGIISMKPVFYTDADDGDFLLRWFSLDASGLEMDKKYTFHNFEEGWYLELDSALATRFSVEQMNGVYFFNVWDEEYESVTPAFTIYALSGSDRDEEAVEGGRFPLYRTESVAYAARMEKGAEGFGITAESLTGSFRLIRQDWRTGETQ